MSDGRDMNERLKKFAAEEEAAGPVATCGRQNAHAVIRDRIVQLRREAHDLEILLDALPARLPTDADQALWNLAISK